MPPGVTIPKHLIPYKPSSQLTNRGDFLYTQSRKCRSVLGDGNCLFRAVSHQLYGSEDQHLQIRHSLCNFIEQNQSKYEPYWIDLTTSFSSHLKDIKNAGCWGTGLEIKACSDYLLTPVFVCSPDVTTGAYRWEKFSPTPSSSGTCIANLPTFPFTVDHIEIAHSSSRDHYDSIISYSDTPPSLLSPPMFRTKVVASLVVE